MSDAQNNNHPLGWKLIYDQLNISPFASTTEIQAKLKSMTDDELNSLKSAFPDQYVMLDSPAKRILINALILDPVNSRHIIDLLSNMPGNLRDSDMKMPELDVNHIVKEGESLEVAQKDFQDIQLDPELEIDMSVIESLLKRRPEPKKIKFDI